MKKKTDSSMDDMNTEYNDITTSFVLNKVLHHIGMSRIIIKKKHLEYDMYKHY